MAYSVPALQTWLFSMLGTLFIFAVNFFQIYVHDIVLSVFCFILILGDEGAETTLLVYALSVLRQWFQRPRLAGAFWSIFVSALWCSLIHILPKLVIKLFVWNVFAAEFDHIFLKTHFARVLIIFVIFRFFQTFRIFFDNCVLRKLNFMIKWSISLMHGRIRLLQVQILFSITNYETSLGSIGLPCLWSLSVFMFDSQVVVRFV